MEDSMAETGKRRISILGSTGSIGQSIRSTSLNQLGGREAFEIAAITGTRATSRCWPSQAKACGASRGRHRQ
jgi:1-deoxy-D-xylulose-5-phosphate reductoisomerase